MLGITVAAPTAGSLAARIAERLKRCDAVMGVAAKSLTTGQTVFVEADRRFPTASAIKTAVMVEVFHQMAEGRFGRDKEIVLTAEAKVDGSGVLQDLHAGLRLTVGDLLVLMMGVSDNTATNLLVGLVGTTSVDRRLESYGLVDTKLFRPTFRDGQADVRPELEREFGLGMSTPRELARLMELIAGGKVVSRAASEEMLVLLRAQQFRTMIPRRLPEGDAVKVGDKPGWDEEKLPGPDGIRRHVRVDAGVVETPRARYVIAVCARQVRDTRWGVDNDALVTGADVARMVHDHFESP
jgi:beta-lactamase class A